MLSALKSFLNNIRYLFHRCDISVKNFIATPYALGFSTLSEDEMSLGVSIIDIGAENTTLSSFYDNNIVFIKHFPVGGDLITRNIARRLGISFKVAEKMKIYQGYVSEHYLQAVNAFSQDETKLLNTEILRSIEKLTIDIDNSLQKLDEKVKNRIVITGGSCQLNGLIDFWSRCFNCPIKNGLLEKHPFFNTSFGLAKYGYYDYFDRFNYSMNSKYSIWTKIKSWFSEDI